MAQTTSHILMIRPRHFGFNEQTAQNNSFQNKREGADANDVAATAVAEFDRFVDVLRSKFINVIVVEDKARCGLSQ